MAFTNATNEMFEDMLQKKETIIRKAHCVSTQWQNQCDGPPEANGLSYIASSGKVEARVHCGGVSMLKTFDSVEAAQHWQKAANDAAATSHFTKTMKELTRTVQDQLKENHCLDVASTSSPEKEQDAVIAISKDIDLATTHDITASFLERTHPFKQDSSLRQSTLHLHRGILGRARFLAHTDSCFKDGLFGLLYATHLRPGGRLHCIGLPLHYKDMAMADVHMQLKSTFAELDELHLAGFIQSRSKPLAEVELEPQDIAVLQDIYVNHGGHTAVLMVPSHASICAPHCEWIKTYEMDKDGKTVSMVESKYITRRMRSESDESFRVLNEIAAAKGGDNQVRISICPQLLKVASSSAFSVAQKDCQEDLSILQSAELGIVRKLPSDRRCFFHMLKAQIEDATHKGDAQEVDVDLPTSAVLEAQIAEATHKGDAQEVDVPSSAVLEAYAHDLPLPMSSYLMSQQHEVSCGGYPFPDPYGWFAPMTVTSRCPISIPYLNYPMIKGPDIPIRLSSSAVLQAYLKVQSSA